MSAYLLVLPLVLIGGGGRLDQILATAATALFVGAIIGWVRDKRLGIRR